MRIKTVHLFFALFILLSGSVTMAQDHGSGEHKPKIRGAIMMANSHVPQASEDGKKIAIIFTWGFDVDYFFHWRWSIALQGDGKLQSFTVEQNDVALERTHPSTIATVIHYHALRHWSSYWARI